MYLPLSDEQVLLADAAGGLLAREETVAAARGALDGASMPDLWALARDAGWPGLLTSEEADGAGLGLYEAVLVLEACGAVLADARLLGHLAACALVESGGGEPDLRRALAGGERRAALVDGLLGHRAGPLRVEFDGHAVRIHGDTDGVLDAVDADVLVVSGLDGVGDAVAAVIEDTTAGVAIAPQSCYDATRSLARVTLDGARGIPLELPASRAVDGRSVQRTLLAAESVGAAGACLKMARDYAVDRHAFGRPIGSYQAIKHKLVEMLRRLECARSLLRYAGASWHRERSELALAANAARVVGADALDYAAPENIFVHGGIGATWEHDAQLYYRRAEVSRRLAGGVDAAADCVAEELLCAAGSFRAEDRGQE
jgi:alkylation response protein AidB-like acyl-CoA dehydrogenase